MLLPNDVVFVSKPNGEGQLHSTFVGLRSNDDGTIEFHLPYGVSTNGLDRISATRLFTKLFMCIEECSRLKPLRRASTGLYDSGRHMSGSFTNDDESQESTLSFGKLRYMKSMRSLIVLTREWDIHEHVSWTDTPFSAGLKKVPDDCIFLEDNSFLPERSQGSARFVNHGVPALCTLLAFLYEDVMTFCGWRAETKISASARLFRELFLPVSEFSLFDAQHPEANRAALLSIMEEIHRNSIYKDDTYWELYDACESYLTTSFASTKPGEVLWGVSSFAFVWELLCLDWFIRYLPDRILFVDIDSKAPNGSSSAFGIGTSLWVQKTNSPYPFTTNVNGIGPIKKMRPDIVIRRRRYGGLGETSEDIFNAVTTRSQAPGLYGLQTFTYTIKQEHRRMQPLIHDFNDICRKANLNTSLIGDKLTVKATPQQMQHALKVMYDRISEADHTKCQIFDAKYWPLALRKTGIRDLHEHEVQAIAKQVTYHVAAQETGLFHSVESVIIVPTSMEQFREPLPPDVVGDYIEPTNTPRFVRELGILVFAAVPEKLIDEFTSARAT